MKGPMKPDELRRYAELIVRTGIAFRRGDTLLVRAGLPHRDLAIALAEAAYRSGAEAVDVKYDDARLKAARISHARRTSLGRRTSWQQARMRAIGTESVAMVQLMGEHDHEVLAKLPPERVAEDNQRLAAGPEMAAIRREGRLRGTICAWPTADWAARVFPGVDSAKATRRLARDLLWFCRLGPSDPPGYRGWTDHLAQIRR